MLLVQQSGLLSILGTSRFTAYSYFHPVQDNQSLQYNHHDIFHTYILVNYPIHREFLVSRNYIRL